MQISLNYTITIIIYHCSFIFAVNAVLWPFSKSKEYSLESFIPEHSQKCLLNTDFIKEEKREKMHNASMLHFRCQWDVFQPTDFLSTFVFYINSSDNKKAEIQESQYNIQHLETFPWEEFLYCCYLKCHLA